MSETRRNLSRIFARQSIEAARNRRRAAAADDPSRARLLLALAAGQDVHARKTLALLEADPGADDAELNEALAAFVDELQDMVMTAATERDAAAESALVHVMKASMNHASMTANAPHDAYCVCTVCGFIAPDAPPERCPVCRAAAELFERLE